MLPPKKHLKPIFCHENNLFVKDDFETEHPDIGHKKRRTVRFSSQKTPKTHIHIMKTFPNLNVVSTRGLPPCLYSPSFTQPLAENNCIPLEI